MEKTLENFVKECTSEELTILNEYITKMEKELKDTGRENREVHCTSRN